jgi:general secretion pathway protein J
MSRDRRHRDAGFTLIDMVVSIVLLALLMALIPSALRLAHRGPEIAAELDRRGAADAGLNFIERHLAEASAIFQRGEDGRLQIVFVGNPDAITFVAPVTFLAGENGLARFDVTIGRDAQGQIGVLGAWRAWQPVVSVSTPGARVAVVPSKSRLLVADATTLRARYFGSLQDQQPPEWSSPWPRADALPDMVELQVSALGETRTRLIVLRLRLP